MGLVDIEWSGGDRTLILRELWWWGPSSSGWSGGTDGDACCAVRCEMAEPSIGQSIRLYRYKANCKVARPRSGQNFPVDKLHHIATCNVLKLSTMQIVLRSPM